MSLRNGRSKQACFQGENRRSGITGRGLRERAGAGGRVGAGGRAGLPAFFGRVHEVRLLILIVLLILFLIVIFLLILLSFGDAALRVPSRGVAEDPGHLNLKMKRPGRARPPVLTASPGT